MNPDTTNPDDLTVEAFERTLLPRAVFMLIPESAREVYRGAGKYCLYAIVDGLEILCEDGVFYVYGMRAEADDFVPWCVLFSSDIPREQIL